MGTNSIGPNIHSITKKMRNISQNPDSFPLAFVNKERICEDNFQKGGPYWHIFTPGESTSLIFRDDDDFRYAMNSFALCLQAYEIKVLAFCLMSNHIHIVAQGKSEQAELFFRQFRSKLFQLFSLDESKSILKEFQPTLLPITDLQALRNTIVYVNRNGYVVNEQDTPFSYRWGSGSIFFCPMFHHDSNRHLGDYSYREKRALFRSTVVRLPDTYILSDGYIHPSCICDSNRGMSFFRDAHHYFNLLSRNNEANMEIARILGEKVFITDQEIYSVVVSICKRDYNTNDPLQLSTEDKLIIAKTLHDHYHSTNKQIMRVLRLQENLVRSMFPTPARSNSNS